MKRIEWNALKSRRLKLVRGVSFEEILQAKLIAIKEHPQKPHQKVMVFEHKAQYWAVPFVEDQEKIFLKTIYPSRKLKREYGGEK